MMKKLRFASSAAAAGAAAIAIGVLLPGSASAAPNANALAGPVLDSTCKWSQVEQALKVQSPETAAQVSGYRSFIQPKYDQPIPARKAAFNQFLQSNGQPGSKASAADTARAKAMAQKVADTCHNYPA